MGKVALLLLFLVSATSRDKFANCAPVQPIKKTLSVMTYNVHIFDIADMILSGAPGKSLLRRVFNVILFAGNLNPIDYEDENRIVSFANQLREMSQAPDVVVLQEVWSNNLAKRLQSAMMDLYPYQFRPCGGASILIGKLFGHGLLLLSKYPIVPGTTSFQPFTFLKSKHDGAKKGFGQASLQVADKKLVTVFFTHTNTDSRAKTLFDIEQLKTAIATHRRAHPNDDILLAGDLNVDGDSEDYLSMMKIFSSDQVPLIDVYLTPGYTYDSESNPLINRFIQGSWKQRLDYVLFYAGNKLLKKVENVSYPKFTFRDSMSNQEMPLSDHYPLMIDFEF